MEMLLEFLGGSFGALLLASTAVLSILMVNIVFPIFAFLKDWRWGLACFFLPGPATLVFAILYFKEVKLLTFLTFAPLVVCIFTFLLYAFLATFFLQPDLS